MGCKTQARFSAIVKVTLNCFSILSPIFDAVAILICTEKFVVFIQTNKLLFDSEWYKTIWRKYVVVKRIVIYDREHRPAGIGVFFFYNFNKHVNPVIVHTVIHLLHTAAAWVRSRSGHEEFVVNKMVLKSVFSEYFFTCQF